jgi:putative ABC transport system substrate-binding protein
MLPSAAGWAAFADAGHLVCYGPNVRAAWRRVAYFVDRVLMGADPSQMPIELPSVVEMVVNRRTAAAMGLVVPTALLVRADRVID